MRLIFGVAIVAGALYLAPDAAVGAVLVVVAGVLAGES